MVSNVRVSTDNGTRVSEPYVLVVDDERPVRESLVRWLNSLGYAAVAVDTADAAIQELTRQLPIAVIADVVMPIHDGLWLLEHVRVRWPSLPVIMATGASLDERALVKARRLGANDFMSKPFGREMLYQALVRAAKTPDD